VNGIIDADGLFNGDRFEHVSDGARYAWPYFWLSSNTFGRLELNYHRIAGRAFSRFKHVPTEEDFWGWVKEFQAAYLLFVYEVNGTFWGQWDTSEKFLPKHKLAADQKSPAPDHTAFSAWRDQYITEKQTRNAAKPITATNFRNPSEIFQHRVGVGVGVGVNTCASNGDARGSVPSIDEPPFGTTEPDAPFPAETAERTKPSREMTAQQDRWFTTWWAEYWLRKAKKAAREAFLKHVKTEERFKRVMDATPAQKPEMLGRESSKRPHGSTWLNGERWEDETANQAPATAQDDYPEWQS
jgi:hypothetical protein